MKLALRVCLAAGLLTAAPAAQTETQYYAVYTDGKKVGHAVSTRLAAGDRVTTTETIVMTMTRLGQAITIKTSETSIETPDGKPLGFSYVQDLGFMATTTNGEVTADGKLSVTSPGQAKPRVSAWPQGAVLAEGLRLLELKQGLKEGTSYDVTVFSPGLGRALASHVTIGGKSKVDLLGRVVTLTEAKTVQDTPYGPIASTSYVDSDQRMLKTIMPAAGITVEMVACDKAFANSPNDVVDFIDKTLLQSPAPLAGLEDAASATYHLQPKPGKHLAGMIATDSQAVQPDGQGGLIVTVRPVKAPAGQRRPYKGRDKAALNALKSSPYLQSDDPKVAALAKQAVGGEKDAAKAAKLIEAFVGKYISAKSLSVGYASAAEVAESKEGDCTEHAVLTAAMCRAAGIPARMVVGYVYVPELGERRDVFGGHAWAEAFIGGKWVGLDATRGRTTPGHVAQAVGDGDPGDFFGLLATMGHFTIASVTMAE